MIKWIHIIIMIFMPVFLFSQIKEEKKEDKKVETTINNVIPVQSQYSKKFTLSKVNFNKRIEMGGKGEILEVEMKLNNKTDEALDLYIFVIATYEDKKDRSSSFTETISETEKIKSFVPYPFDMKNFEYPQLDKKGNPMKDKNGKDLMIFHKYPKNTKAGIEEATGKPYNLVKEKFVRTIHLSKYRSYYYFFNEVAIIIFDSEGKPVFRQLYDLRGIRK